MAAELAAAAVVRLAVLLGSPDRIRWSAGSDTIAACLLEAPPASARSAIAIASLRLRLSRLESPVLTAP